MSASAVGFSLGLFNLAGLGEIAGDGWSGSGSESRGLGLGVYLAQ